MENITFNTTDTNIVYVREKFSDYFNDYVSVNETVPQVKDYHRDQRLVLAIYGVLMTMGFVGNLAVLVTLSKSKRRRSRMQHLMTHLALADMCVTCGVIPLEMVWKYTNAWLAGNFFCKTLLVLRAFGLYLSSNILVCISIDRFLAVFYPLKVHKAQSRSKKMLWVAWIIALFCSLPQSLVFRVMRHPLVPTFEQCVSFQAFKTRNQEVAYNVFCLSAMYFVPLLVITTCYLRIFFEIRASAQETIERCFARGEAHARECVAGRGLMERARRQTLRMTMVIVSVFAFCWMPYAIMAMWYMVDQKSASKVSPRIQDLLFAMAVSNSCMNPLVYGSYTLRIRRVFKKMIRKLCCDFSTLDSLLGNNSGSNSSKNKNNNHLSVKCVRGVRFADMPVVPACEPRGPARHPPLRLRCAPMERRRVLGITARGEAL